MKLSQIKPDSFVVLEYPIKMSDPVDNIYKVVKRTDAGLVQLANEYGHQTVKAAQIKEEVQTVTWYQVMYYDHTIEPIDVIKVVKNDEHNRYVRYIKDGNLRQTWTQLDCDGSLMGDVFPDFEQAKASLLQYWSNRRDEGLIALKRVQEAIEHSSVVYSKVHDFEKP